MSKKRCVPRRGDVIRLDFNPQKGHEQAGRRPALVLSPTDYNRQIGLAVVCPITSEVKGYPWEVAFPDTGFVSGAILSDQVKSVAWRERAAEFVCALEGDVVEEVVAKVFALLRPEEE